MSVGGESENESFVMHDDERGVPPTTCGNGLREFNDITLFVRMTTRIGIGIEIEIEITPCIMIIMIIHLRKEWLHQIGITSFLPNHALIRNKNPPVRPRKHSQHCDLLANSDLVINHPLHNKERKRGRNEKKKERESYGGEIGNQRPRQDAL